MAMLTRFFSQTPVAPAIDQVKANPDVYASVAAAEAQGAAQVYGTVTDEFNKLFDVSLHTIEKERVHNQQLQREQEHAAKVAQAQQRELERLQHQQDRKDANLYLAVNQAQMSASMFDTMRQAKADVQPGGNIVNPVLQKFDEEAQRSLVNAPNAIAAESLQRSFIGYRTRVAQSALGVQDKLNTEHLMATLSETTQKLSSVVSDEPGQLELVKAQLETLANSLKDNGMPANRVDQSLKMHLNNLETVAALSMSEKHPREVLTELSEGGFDSLGSQTKAAMSARATGALKAQQTLVQTGLNDVQKRLMEGLPLNQDLVQLTNEADANGLSPQANQIRFYNQLNEEAKKLTLPQLEQRRLDVISEAMRKPETTVGMLEYLNKFYSSRLKAVRNDPFEYASNQGIIPSGASLPQFLPGDDISDPSVREKFRKLQIYSAEVQQHYGLGEPVVPLTKGNIELVHQKLLTQSPEEQIKSLEALGQFGTDTLYKTAEVIAPKSPGLAMAIGLLAKEKNTAVTSELQAKQDELAQEVLKGMPILNQALVGKQTGASRPKELEPHGDVNRDVLGGLFENDPQIVGQFEQSARAIAAYRSLNGKENPEYRDALKEITGVVELGQLLRSGDSYKTIPPVRGWTEDDMGTLVDKMNSVKSWQQFGNGKPYYADGTEIDFNKTPSYKFKFIPVDSHRYVVMQSRGGKDFSVKNEAGSPYVINLFKAADFYSKPDA